jgi:malate synthase
MSSMTERAGLQVAQTLVDFIEERALPGTGIEDAVFWNGLSDILARFTPLNCELLAERDRIQAELDRWHTANPGAIENMDAYQAFLRAIGYLDAEPQRFSITTENVDSEIAVLAGPQLVVPSLNGRFVLNAANARWGSLYDALYGSDALDAPPARTREYDALRGAAAVRAAKAFLNRVAPLRTGGWEDWQGTPLVLAEPAQLIVQRADGVLLRNNGLHIELIIDRSHDVGQSDPAGICDVILEAALTTIVDLEDSVAAVDADDKVAAYSNWLGLMRGDLEATFVKDDRVVARRLSPDKNWGDLTLNGRSLLLIRNVGLLMTTKAVLLADGREAPEGIVDAVVTCLCALHDLKGLGRYRNSRTGSIYIVKPKLHGPKETAFCNALFDAVEDLLALRRHTIKIGIMDEERRTSANLLACIREAKHRIAFINTGFLDRTGDEIHTAMQAGPVIRKADMKSAKWIAAYERRNVQAGLMCGFSGKAQIGKGMWAAPDKMADMMKQKRDHLQAGANTAWVPSPTAATLHAMHYHEIDVFARQAVIANEDAPPLDALLTIPVRAPLRLDDDAIREELENNAQGILGYVVRWINQGIGCSKVPDLHDVGLMEDRATLRISSQHIANWLLHGVVTPTQVEAVLQQMAARVDAQNAGDSHYEPMTPDTGQSAAFQAACALIFDGADQPNGYTEPLLHAFRRAVKARATSSAVAHV